MELATPARPHGRGLCGGDRSSPGEDRLNLLLVAYFYPPCRDTGAHRPAAMAKWLRRLGHRVTVLTTSAYGTDDDATEEGTVPHARPTAPARPPARPRPGGRPVRLRHLLGPAARPQQGDRAGTAGRRLGAVRPQASAAAESPRAIRLRDHELASRVGPRRRQGASAAGRPLGGGPPRRLDLRADPTALSHPAAATPRRGPRTTLASLRRRGRLRQSPGGRRPARAPRDRAAAGPQRLGPGPDRAERFRQRRRHPRPRPGLARLHRAVRELRARSRPPRPTPWASSDGSMPSRRRAWSWSSRAP